MSRDWFTVFVELMVLVVGIFLGLQADDWNQRRLDSIEEQYYLDRLSRDFKRSLSEQEAQLEIAKTKFEIALSVQRVLEARDLGNMTDTEFQDRMARTRGFPAPRLVTATIEELISGGNASLLQSNVLREELAVFIDWYTDLESYYDNVSSSIIDAYDRQYRVMRPEWNELTSPPKWSADAEALMNDPDAIASMRQLTNSYWVLWRDLRWLNRETRKINELLIEVSGDSHEARMGISDRSTLAQ